ncbi:MAG: succinylglutamate-semialdehyde dehydrogenase [Gammaproteobacteria bacterium]|nr:succinylglutamate-semialdehyde dehydrogenase [Gammaproteobacteria bacterium]|tara:strand:- start:154 stop:1617 length:1464 start_codon:yes stop_codon:yes gene_type:complete
MQLRQLNFIDGKWLRGSGGEFSSENPALGETIWTAYSADRKAVDAAVAAAKKAFRKWKLLGFKERCSYIDAFIEKIENHSNDLAQAIHRETGKPLWESKTEVATMIAKASVSLKAYQERTGESKKEVNNVLIQLVHRPIGVFAVLGPYNFPGHLPNGHIIPALLAGNTIVFKPSELTPLFGELMMQCWEEAGIPSGVINLVQGARETGQFLVNAQELNGVLFTGSSKTGHAIHTALAGQPHKMLALEMGGNNPLVVDEVKNVKAAIHAVIQSAFISAGQRCTCARRLILVRNRINEELLEKLVTAMRRIKVGSSDECFMGPVISNAAADHVEAFEKLLLEKGAKQLVPLLRLKDNLPFLRPALIDVTNLEEIQDEECFGPLLQVKWVEDLDAAIEEANNTNYGLSAGLLSDHSSSWDKFFSKVRAGIINFNRPITGASGAAPFGGVGASGNYRPGAYYAADYSAYPIASMLSETVELPEDLVPGIAL